MDNVPPPPPALVVRVATPDWIAQLGGQPAWRVGPTKTRLKAICWDDGAAPKGLKPAPVLPNLPCFIPDVTTAEGQAWLQRFNVTVLEADRVPELAVR